MEITNNQIKLQALDDNVSAKASIVSASKPMDVKNTASATIESELNADSSKTAEKLQVAVSQINDHMQNLQRNLQFTVDEASGRDVVTVIDSKSKEVIRQLPSEEALVLARRLAENKENDVQLISEQV